MGVAALVITLAALTLVVIVFFRLIIYFILCLASLDAQVLVKALEDPLDRLVVQELLELLWADFLALQDFIIFFVILLFLVINIYIVIIIVG
jgi:hypothetical protein